MEFYKPFDFGFIFWAEKVANEEDSVRAEHTEGFCEEVLAIG
jgi:hypothetical protein